MPDLRLSFVADDRASAELKRVSAGLERSGRAARKAGNTIKKGTEKADRALKKTSTQATKTAKALGGLASSTAAVRVGLGLITFAATTLGLQNVAIQFLENERAVLKLNNALKLNNEFTPQAAARIRDLARALEIETGASEVALLNQFALARSFTNSAEQAEALLKASLDFAVGAELQTTEAVRRLGRAVRGSASDVANFVPAIRDLTKEQLAAGEATRLIQERFAGAASELGKALRGTTAITQAFRDLKIRVGDELVPVFDAWARSLNTALQALEDTTGASKVNLTVQEAALAQLEEQLLSVSIRAASEERFGRVVSKSTQTQLTALLRLIAKTKELIAAEKTRGEEQQKTTETAIVRTKEQQAALVKFFNSGEELRIQRIEAEGRDTEARRERIQQELDQRLAAIEAAFVAAEGTDTALRDLAINNAEAINAAQRQALNNQINGLEELRSLATSVAGTFESGFSQAFANTLLEGESFGEAMEQVFKNIVKVALEEFAKIAIRRTLFAGLGGAFGGALGGGLPGFEHGTRRVPGPVGQPVAAILHGGETVNTAGSTPTATGAGGGGGGANVTINQTIMLGSLSGAGEQILREMAGALRANTDGAREFASEADLAAARNAGRSS